MPLRLDTRAEDFERGFARLLAAREAGARGVDGVVAKILADVTSRLIVNRAALKTRHAQISPLVARIAEAARAA